MSAGESHEPARAWTVDVSREVRAGLRDAPDRAWMKVRLAMAVDAIDERDATIADLEARLVTLAGETGRQATIIAGLTSTVEDLTAACERLRGQAPLTRGEAQAWERLRDAAETIEDILITAHVDFDSDEQQERFTDARWQALDAIKKTRVSGGEIPPEVRPPNAPQFVAARRQDGTLTTTVNGEASPRYDGRRCDQCGERGYEGWNSWQCPGGAAGFGSCDGKLTDEERCHGCNGPLGEGAQRQGEAESAVLCATCIAKATAEDKARADDAGGDEPARWAARVQAQRDRLHDGDPAKASSTARPKIAGPWTQVGALALWRRYANGGAEWAGTVGVYDNGEVRWTAWQNRDDMLPAVARDGACRATDQKAIDRAKAECDCALQDAGWALDGDAAKAPDPRHDELRLVRMMRPDVLASTDAGNPDDAPDSVREGGAR